MTANTWSRAGRSPAWARRTRSWKPFEFSMTFYYGDTKAVRLTEKSGEHPRKPTGDRNRLLVYAYEIASDCSSQSVQNEGCQALWHTTFDLHKANGRS